MISIKSCFFLFFTVCGFNLFGQIDSFQAGVDTVKLDSLNDIIYNEARFSVHTGNNIVQVGQVMSSSELYFRPAINYYHKSGLYIGGNVTFMPTDTSKVLDNYSLNFGYDKDLSKVVSTGIDYTFSQYFTYKQVTSSASHIVRPYISFDNNFLIPTLTPAFLIGSSVDVSMQLDFTHIYKIKSIFKKNDKLTIPISFGLNGGTSEFYNVYARGSRSRGGRILLIDTTTISRFALTSIYAMATLKYKVKNTSLSFNTSYYMTHDTYTRNMVSNPLIFRFTVAYYLSKN